MIEVFKEKHELGLFCDMHGHGKKKNVFMYGCGLKSYDINDMRRNLLAKVVPHMMSKRNQLFSFKDSHFRYEKSKLTTARIVVYSQFEVPHSYTLEASFFGPKNLKALGADNSSETHMNESHLETLGRDLCKMCMMFTNKRNYMQNIRNTNDYLRTLLSQRMTNLGKSRDQSTTQKDRTKENTESPEPAYELEEDKEEFGSELIYNDFDTLEGDISFKDPNFEDLFKMPIDIVDCPDEDSDSGGSESCPSEHEDEHLADIKTERFMRRAFQSPILAATEDSKFMPKEPKYNATPIPSQTPTVLNDLSVSKSIVKAQSFKKAKNRTAKSKPREDSLKLNATDNQPEQYNINKSNITFNFHLNLINHRQSNQSQEPPPISNPIRFNEELHTLSARKSFDREFKGLSLIRDEYLPRSKIKKWPKKTLLPKIEGLAEERCSSIFNPEERPRNFTNRFILRQSEKTRAIDLSFINKEMLNALGVTRRFK